MQTHLSAVNSCSDINELTHSITYLQTTHICVHPLTFQYLESLVKFPQKSTEKKTSTMVRTRRCVGKKSSRREDRKPVHKPGTRRPVKICDRKWCSVCRNLNPDCHLPLELD